MIKVICSILAIVVVSCATLMATEPIGLEVRKRNSIGRLGLVKVQLTTKAEADGTLVVSFQAPEAGTYTLNYTNGPKKGKTATIVRVEKAGPVSTKIAPIR